MAQVYGGRYEFVGTSPVAHVSFSARRRNYIEILRHAYPLRAEAGSRTKPNGPNVPVNVEDLVAKRANIEPGGGNDGTGEDAQEQQPPAPQLPWACPSPS